MSSSSTSGDKDHVKSDPAVQHFVLYMENERNASKHTIGNYLIDIRQFARFCLGAESRRPSGLRKTR